MVLDCQMPAFVLSVYWISCFFGRLTRKVTLVLVRIRNLSFAQAVPPSLPTAVGLDCVSPVKSLLVIFPLFLFRFYFFASFLLLLIRPSFRQQSWYVYVCVCVVFLFRIYRRTWLTI